MKDIIYLAIASVIVGVAIAVRHYVNKDDEPKNPHGFGNGDDETSYEEQGHKLFL
jgi:hypothetical protein